jgi:hypothetical protein
VAQGVSPEFKPQYNNKKKKKEGRREGKRKKELPVHSKNKKRIKL